MKVVIARVLPLLVIAVALFTVGPSPGWGAVFAAVIILSAAFFSQDHVERWLYRLLTLLPALLYVLGVLILNWTLNSSSFVISG